MPYIHKNIRDFGVNNFSAQLCYSTENESYTPKRVRVVRVTQWSIFYYHHPLFTSLSITYHEMVTGDGNMH